MSTELINKVLRFGEGRGMKQRMQRVQRINALEPEIQDLSDTQIRERADGIRARLADGAQTDEVLDETFALVREASWRALGMRPFDVQLIGAMVLDEGQIAEMKTGEGKTLSAVPAVVLNALTGKGVHVVTVNDYLAGRDANWMRPIYEFLGLTVGVIGSMMPEAERRDAYAADITYGTNSEFGFDYLRDNMAVRLDDCVQRGHVFCIVDEVDSILIDEARTPLIISGVPEAAADTYYRFARIIPTLKKGDDYEVDEKHRTVAPLESGVEKVERALGIDHLYLDIHGQLVNHFIQGLKAESLFRKDKEYIVRDGEVLIVDEFTGRVLEGRRYSEGLHQAIEAKEGLKIREENQTLATITLQNYFRMYDKLSGMTGTASTEANEFAKIYETDVVTIPTHRPMVRRDDNDLIFKTKDAKFNAVAAEIQDAHKRGQPVLVGTISVSVSEMLSGLLERRGVPHTVLNAKQHDKEAETIARAGEQGSVTIATNMAGRGVDIKLGDGVEELGGLCVIGPSATRAGASTTSCAAAPGARATPGSPSSSCPPRTTSSASSRVTACTRSSTAWGRATTSPLTRRCSRRRSKAPRRRSRNTTSTSASGCSSTTTCSTSSARSSTPSAGRCWRAPTCRSARATGSPRSWWRRWTATRTSTSRWPTGTSTACSPSSGSCTPCRSRRTTCVTTA